MTMRTREGVAVLPTREHWQSSALIEPSSIVARSTLRARIEGTKGVASRIALTLADSPFPAEACNTPSLAVWPCSSGLPPLFRQPRPPPLLPAFSASASAFVHALPYPNSYPRKHRYVHRPGRREISRFTTSSCGFHGLRRSRLDRSLFFSFLFFSPLFSFPYATRSVKRSRDPSANCTDSSLSLFFFFHSSPVPLTLSTASFHRSPVSSCTEYLRSLPGILSPLPRRD